MGNIMRARIYVPAKNAMQSGRARTKQWTLEYEPEQPREIDPLMGWTSSSDMKSQLTLKFDTKEQAVDYATRNGIPYRVEAPKPATRKVISYSDNFKYNRLAPWSH